MSTTVYLSQSHFSSQYIDSHKGQDINFISMYLGDIFCFSALLCGVISVDIVLLTQACNTPTWYTHDCLCSVRADDIGLMGREQRPFTAHPPPLCDKSVPYYCYTRSDKRNASKSVYVAIYVRPDLLSHSQTDQLNRVFS